MHTRRADKRKPTTIAILLGTVLVLASCSGGGGSVSSVSPAQSNDLPYTSTTFTGAKQAAVIDTDNALQIFEDFRVIVGPPKFSLVVDGNGIVEDSSVMSMAISFIELAQLRESETAPYSQQIVETDDCSGGGQIRIAANFEPIEKDNKLAINFYSCVEDTMTIDGELRISSVDDLAVPSGISTPRNARYDFIDFTANDGVEQIKYDGSVPCIYSSYPQKVADDIDNFSVKTNLGNFSCTSVNLNIEDSTGDVYRLEDFSFSNTSWKGSARGREPTIIDFLWKTYTFGGRFYHTEHGYVDIAAPSANFSYALVDYAYDAPYFPWQIQIKMSGANDGYMQTYFSEIPSIDSSTPFTFDLLINGETTETAENVISIEF